MQINNNNQAPSFKGLYDPNVLITGATGYIGSNLTGRLAREGYNCIIASRNQDKTAFLQRTIEAVNATKKNKSLFSFVNLDLTQPENLRDVFTKSKPIDAVVHLGGLTSNGQSFREAPLYWRTNVGGTQNLLDGMLEAGTDKILFMSTGSTYGKLPDKTPITELLVQNPETPYANTKLAAERMIQDYEKSNTGLKSIILRLFNVAGTTSKDDLTPGINVISVLFERIKSNSPFTLMGNKFDTPDGTCIKDFIHVSDVCEAATKSLGVLLSNKKSNVFNLGSGEGTSLGTIIRKGQEISGKGVQLAIKDAPEGETSVMIVDNSKIKKALSWRPKKTMDDILKSTWEWIAGNSK